MQGKLYRIFLNDKFVITEFLTIWEIIFISENIEKGHNLLQKLNDKQHTHTHTHINKLNSRAIKISFKSNKKYNFRVYLAFWSDILARLPTQQICQTISIFSQHGQIKVIKRSLRLAFIEFAIQVEHSCAIRTVW